MDNGQIHHGSCFCGSVRLTVTGTPEAMGYCHCESCRHWSAAPVNAFTLWRPEAVTIGGNREDMVKWQKTPNSHRYWCRNCGGHVLTEHPQLGLTDVYAAILPETVFEPSVHVHYQEAVLRIHDGLPKLRDIPAELGGSGTTMPE